jgi:hypothetical protein
VLLLLEYHPSYLQKKELYTYFGTPFFDHQTYLHVERTFKGGLKVHPSPAASAALERLCSPDRQMHIAKQQTKASYIIGIAIP